MNILSGLAVIMIVLGLLVGIASLIVLIIMKFTKKDLKASAVLTGSAFGVVLLGIGLAFIANFVQVMNEPIATSTASYPTSSSDAQSAEGVDDTEYEITDEQREEFNREYDEKMEEAKEEREADEDRDSHLTKDGRNPSDFTEYNADVDMRDIERNPEDFENEWIAFEGRIVQVIEDDVMTAYRIAVNDDIDRMVYLETASITLDERLLEDDHVEVYGAFYDLVTYETIVGSNRTIPAFSAHGERIILQDENLE